VWLGGWEKVMETGSRVAHILEKGLEKFITFVFNEFKLATNNRLGYDMPRLKLKMICTARFWIMKLHYETMKQSKVYSR